MGSCDGWATITWLDRPVQTVPDSIFFFNFIISHINISFMFLIFLHHFTKSLYSLYIFSNSNISLQLIIHCQILWSLNYSWYPIIHQISHDYHLNISWSIERRNKEKEKNHSFSEVGSEAESGIGKIHAWISLHQIVYRQICGIRIFQKFESTNRS